MDKTESIHLFIRNYYKLLTDSSLYDRDEYKKLKRKYFVNDCKIPGQVKDKEIVEILMPILIKNRAISNIENLKECIASNPFLKYTNAKAEEYEFIIKKQKQEFLDRELFRDLEEDKKIELLKEQIIKEREPELLAEIENKKKEKEKLEKELISIIDDMIFEEPSTYDLSSSPLEWWEELNLIKNPFPSSNGFSLIDEELFEKILIDTPPFQWMLKKLSSNTIDFWGKGFLIDGALGTGKTTFYDFFKPKFILKKIEPFRIIITDKISVAHYNTDFENQLVKKLKSILKTHHTQIDSNDYEELMFEFQTNKDTAGFVIFIDDLHKNINIKVVFDFLSTLQLYKNKFYENGINVAFFISGLPDWSEKIKLDQKLTSFFDAPLSINMPEVSPEQAASALQKRLLAFSRSENRSFSISKQFLNYIFTSEKKNRTIVGFRAYIDSAKRHFEAKQFDVLGLAPNNIPAHLLSLIQKRLEDNVFFKTSLGKLVYSGGKLSKTTLNRCIDQIRLIYLETYVLESDLRFSNKNNLMLLKRLSDSFFIIKSSVEKGAWKIHPLLIELNEEIRSEFTYSLEDYLIQIYGIPENYKTKEPTNAFTLVQKKIKIISEAVSHSEAAILAKLVEEIKAIYDLEESNDGSIISFLKTHNLTEAKLSYLLNSLALLMIEFETPSISNIYGQNNIRNWSSRFRNLEYFPDFIYLINIENIESEDAEVLAARIVSSTHKAFEELIGEFESSIHVRQLIDNLPLMHFNKKYLSNLFTLSDFIESKSFDEKTFFDIVTKYLNNIETSFKEYIFVMSKLIFGEQRFNFYPDNINIQNYGVNYFGPTDCYNEFGNLERSSFHKIFLASYPQNDAFSKFIIKPITSKWPEKELSVFYTHFIEFDMITSHKDLTKVSYLRKNIRTFLHLSSKLVSDFSETISKLIFSESLVYEEGDQMFVTYSCRPRVSGNELKIAPKYIDSIPKTVSRHNITEAIKDSNLFIDTFFTDKILELDLLNLEEVMKTVPGKKYPAQLGTLLYLIQLNKIKPIQIYGFHYIFESID